MDSENELTGYKLSRDWFDFAFENPSKVRPIHAAIYFFAIEHCNRLGWKKEFGFPSQMAMEAVGVKNWRTYIKAFNDLVDWGFFELVEKSKNQYSSNVIAIVKNTEARTKALDKALQKHSQKQSNSTVSINKPYNNKPLNKEQERTRYPFNDFWDDYDKKKDKKKSEAKWKRVNETDRQKIKEFIPVYKRYEPNPDYRKNPTTFLNSEIWNDDWSAYPPKEQRNNQNHGNNTARTKGDEHVEFLTRHMR